MDQDPLVTAPVETRVTFWCPGGSPRFEVINNRWIRELCRSSRCKRDGVHAFHVWDLVTGRLVKTEYETVSPSAGDTR